MSIFHIISLACPVSRKQIVSGPRFFFLDCCFYFHECSAIDHHHQVVADDASFFIMCVIENLSLYVALISITIFVWLRPRWVLD